MNFNRKDDAAAKDISDRFRIPFPDVIKNALVLYFKSLELQAEGFEIKGVREKIASIQFRSMA